MPSYASSLDHYFKHTRSQPLFLLSHSPEETFEIAKSTASFLKAGDLLGLQGDLGAGKTTFVKGLAAGLGLKEKDEVKSPTFVLMHIYPTKIPLYHFDLYRLETDQEMQSTGIDEFVGDRQGITCIEWADKAKNILTDKAYWIELEWRGESSRAISIRKGTKGSQ